jgi:hypothetical protein
MSGQSIAEPGRGARFRFGRFLFAILLWRRRFERMNQATRSRSYFVDRGLKRGIICFRRFVKAADFSDELKRSVLNFFGRDGRIKIEEWFDVSAHSHDLGETWLNSLLFPLTEGTG